MTRKTMILAGAGALFLTLPVFGQSLGDRFAQVQARRAAAVVHQQDLTSKPAMLSALLYTDISVNFQDTQARDAINFIANNLGINIIGRYSDDRAGTGIDPMTPINLQVQNRPALTVLEMVLEQCQDEFDETSWQLREGFVEIGTKERLNAARELRIYPVRELLFEPLMFDDAPRLDLDAALQGGGGGGGGGGFGGGGGGSGGGGFGGGLGGGGGGGGGFGGGGGGSGSGGSIFEDRGDAPDRISPEEYARELIDIIVSSVEPFAWEDAGGLAASIRYYKGTLLILAPDYIHRQVGGYPFAIRPVRGVSAVPTTIDRRYVTMTTVVGQAKVIGVDTLEFTGFAGGSGQ